MEFLELNKRIDQLSNNINSLVNLVNSQTETINLLIKSRQKSNKFEILLEKLKLTKNLETNQIMTLCSVSRPWAIDLMKRLPFYDNQCIYHKGDRHNPCRVVYKELQSDDLSQYARKLVEHLDRNPTMSGFKIIEYLKCNFGEAKKVVLEIKQKLSESYILEIDQRNATNFKIIRKQNESET